MTKAAPAVPRLHTTVVLLLALFAAALFSLLATQPVFAQTPTPTESPLTNNRPVLGILALTSPDGRGVTVARVVPNGGAEGAGLQSGDLITDIEGTKVAALQDLTTAIEKFKIDDTVTVTFERAGQSQTAELKLGSSQSSRRVNPFQIPNFEPRFPEDVPSNPDVPSRPDVPRAPSLQTAPAGDTDYRPVLILFGTLITGALIALIVLTTRKNRPAAAAPVQAAAYVPPAASRSDALDILKMRYAKGEITRDEYLTMSSDLNGAGVPPSESPTQEL